jgi:hypothetical protein
LDEATRHVPHKLFVGHAREISPGHTHSRVVRQRRGCCEHSFANKVRQPRDRSNDSIRTELLCRYKARAPIVGHQCVAVTLGEQQALGLSGAESVCREPGGQLRSQQVGRYEGAPLLPRRIVLGVSLKLVENRAAEAESAAWQLLAEREDPAAIEIDEGAGVADDQWVRASDRREE